MARPAPLLSADPTSLGGYELVGRLGVGGQGIVYLGRTAAGESVAIKLLHDRMNADPTARSRLGREVAAARQVAAFCTARVLDSDLDGPRPYVVSEFIDGRPLQEVVTGDGPYTGTALERLAIGVATALAAIHRHGVVHRDLKPANVLIGSDGPRVVDFGIARPARPPAAGPGAEPLTATGTVIGTPGYVAPELFGGAEPTPAVDIFAWGATITFAATGRLPFEGDTPRAAIDRMLHGTPELHGMTGLTAELVAECLASDPAQRPVADDLLLRLLGYDKAPQAGSGDLLDRGSRVAATLPASSPTAPVVPPSPRGTPAAPSGAVPLPAESAPTRSSSSGVAVVVSALLALLLLVPGGYIAIKTFPRDPGSQGRSSPAPTSSLRSAPAPPASPPPAVPRTANSPAAVPPAASASSVIPADYAGTWTGTGYQSDGQKWQVTVTLSAGVTTGKVSYSTPCSGRLELAEVGKKDIEFTETITKISKRRPCIRQGIVVMSRKGNGMDYVYRTHPGQKPPYATARLLKKD